MTKISPTFKAKSYYAYIISCNIITITIKRSNTTSTHDKLLQRNDALSIFKSRYTCEDAKTIQQNKKINTNTISKNIFEELLAMIYVSKNIKSRKMFIEDIEYHFNEIPYMKYL